MFQIGGVSKQNEELFTTQLKRLNSEFRKHKNATKYRHEVSKLTTAIVRNERAARKAIPTYNKLRTTMVALSASFGAFAIGREIFNTGRELDGIRASMLLFAKDADGVAESMDYIRGEADRLGISLLEAMRNFSKFSIVARNKMSKEDIRALFSGFSEFATVMQVDQFRFGRGMMALQQMMSKGKIMAEELKNQLAENIPGSLEVFEKATGLTGQALWKAMENGQLLAEEVLPKVAKEYAKAAREGGALEKAVKRVAVQQQRFLNMVTVISDEIFKSGFGEGMAVWFKEMSDSLKKLLPTFRTFGRIFGNFIKGITVPLKFVADTLAMIGDALSVIFNNEFGGFIAKLAGLTAAFFALGRALKIVGIGSAVANKGLLALATNPVVLFGIGAAAAVEDVYTFFKGGESVTGKIVDYAKNKPSELIYDAMKFKFGAPITTLKVDFNSEEAKKFVRVEAEGVQQQELNNSFASVGS